MENKPIYYDLHSHILPGMDDGCKSCEESAYVLQLSRKQGVAGIMATSHYYPKETIESFLGRRSQAYQKLLTYLQEQEFKVPRICLGAEVYYHPGLIQDNRLEDLCLGKSGYLLLELPFGKWNSQIIRDVYSFSGVRGIVPIVAHLERYRNFVDKKQIEELLSCDVLVKMNGEYYLDRATHRKARKWLKDNMVQVMGSDCHNAKDRRPNLGIALDQMEEEKLEDCRREIIHRSREIFLEALRGREEYGKVD